MPVLQRFPASRILLYAGDPLLPHVHVDLSAPRAGLRPAPPWGQRTRGAALRFPESDGRECTVDIETLAIKGRIAAREIREELEWIPSKHPALLDEWRRYNP